MIDNVTSKYMTGYRSGIFDLKEKKFTCMVELRDNSTYLIHGVGSTYFQLSLGDTLHVEDILYFPKLKKNLLSVSVLEDKGF